jgi:hypothetical protein
VISRYRLEAYATLGEGRLFKPSCYFRFFKVDGETVKEISFDAGLSLPAAS